MPLEPPTVYVTESMAWEYKYVRRMLRKGGVPTEGELNAMGKQGWELAAAFSDSDYIHVYFKRPIEGTARTDGRGVRQHGELNAVRARNGLTKRIVQPGRGQEQA